MEEKRVMCKDLPCPGACGYWGINLWWKEKWRKKGSLSKPQGTVPQSHPSVTDRRAVSPALIPWSTLSTICSWTQGPKSAPGLSQVLLQSTHSLPVLMLSDTQATHRAMLHSRLQHFKRATIGFIYIYINQLGLHVYIMSFSPLGVGMIQKRETH